MKSKNDFLGLSVRVLVPRIYSTVSVFVEDIKKTRVHELKILRIKCVIRFCT